MVLQTNILIILVLLEQVRRQKMKGSIFAKLITIARKERGISQARACELIGIGDPSTLSKWETGTVVPSEEMAMKLMDAYDDPIIGYMYLQECTMLGNRLLPSVLLSELDNLALNFQYEFEDVQELRRDILEIARDGVVDENEKPRWIQIQSQAKGLFCTLLPMMIRNFDKEKSPCKAGTLQELM